MAYPIEVKEKAICLRQKGFSINQIVAKLDISKGTASVWLKNVFLSEDALKKLSDRGVAAQFKSKKTRLIKRQAVFHREKLEAEKMCARHSLSTDWKKVLCAILFWTEGSKDRSCVSFINSDPKMISVFMQLLRESFDIDEKKFRGLIHIHEYHDEQEALDFWSGLSKIPISQFSKSYRKSNTAKRKRINYNGSFRIRYYDSSIARELYSIYTTLPDFLSGNIGP